MADIYYTCAECRGDGCQKPGKENLPKNCPMRLKPELLSEARQCYEDPEVKEFFFKGAMLEKDGYCKYPRLKETIAFCQRLGYDHVGIAFCGALTEEAAEVSKLFRSAGIRVDSVRCKCGGVNKPEFGIPKEKFVKGGDYEPACNPIGQAMLLNEKKTKFNIVIGLCVGHDSLFLKHSDAMSTVLLVKDRVTGHNPAAAIYLHHKGYWGDMKEE